MSQNSFFFFFFFFFSGGLIFLLIFFNVLMMYKNIFFYTFRNFLEFVIITIVSKSRFSQKWKSRMFIFERASLNFDTVYEVILMYFIKAWSWLLKKIGKQTGKVGLFQGWSIIPVGLLLSFSVHFSLVYYSRWSIIRDSIVVTLNISVFMDYPFSWNFCFWYWAVRFWGVKV